MKEKIFIRRSFVKDNKIDDDMLLLLCVMSSEYGDLSSHSNLVSLQYLTDLFLRKEDKRLLKKMKDAFNKLVELDIIKVNKEYKKGSYLVDTSNLYFDKSESFLNVYWSDMRRFSEDLNGCNLAKINRLYVCILNSMDFSSDLPYEFRNKVYHFGMNYLLKKTGFDKRTYSKYLDVLLDNNILYLVKGRMPGSQYISNFISRFDDKNICDAFVKSNIKNATELVSNYNENKSILN